MLQRVIVPLALSVVLATVTRADRGDHWPRFRGPEGDGIATASEEPPTSWSKTDNIAWRAELPGEGWSSPVIGVDQVFLTAAIPQTKNPEVFDLSLLIVDLERGRLIKTIKVMEQNSERRAFAHSKNSHASPTPILDGDRVYVHFGYQGTACLKRNGEMVWINRDLYFKPTHGNGGSPILVGDRLVFTCDGDRNPRVVALDADTGEVVWETPRPISAVKTFSFATPTAIEVDGQVQIVAPGSDCVLALDPMTGSIIWDVRYDGYSVVPKPVFDGKRVYVATSFDSSKLLAIRPTGRGVVTDTHVDWRVSKNVPKTPSMIVHDGLVYSVSDNGIMQCVDTESGDVVYRERIGGNFSASPVLAGGNVYLTSEQGVTTVVKTGREFQEVAENNLAERTLASIAVVDQSILIRTADALYRVDP